ncbi:iron-containing alcohol dehydrogenase [Vibrio sp. CAIM 722]|uniref:Iron-containing alcohol dehydrogenase n=1 Tax=Vibrio eleionomae TaxID=2653505 RepID=A0A7X4RVY9_9VIBR|nr:iron-containing alcohol dehydrogenase family protein [Vibrio eleionomae]MZI95063.1 iron-containing alcohol dehydrogenase [Vibrio eleionomae]
MSNTTMKLPFTAHVLRGKGALNDFLPAVATRGQRLFIIGGERALSSFMPKFDLCLAQHSEHNFVVEQHWHGGEVSQTNIDQLTAKARDFKADVIIGVGGGKAIDMGKAVAESVGCPAATIPTIAATCAANSSVSVVYHDNGHYDYIYMLSNAPEFVVLDSELIADAPVRWLSAGLGDTLAKLYEFRAIASKAPDCSLNMSAFSNGKLCYDVIAKYGEEAVAEVNRKEAGFALEQVMDAIFIFAALTSTMGVGDHVAAAHAIYDGFTVIDKTRHFGHGLLVGFGNLCLLSLEERSDEEIIEEIKLAKKCGVPVTLNEIADLTEEELTQVCAAAVATSDMDNMPMSVSTEQTIAAMHHVSKLASSL